jgi:hypothetical protein
LREQERERKLLLTTRRAIGDAILKKFKQPTKADWHLITASLIQHVPHEYRIDLSKRCGCCPKAKQPSTADMLSALDTHVSKLDATGCFRLMLDIAMLQDIRTQYRADADVNLKKLAQRFHVDPVAIAKEVRAQSTAKAAKAIAKPAKKGAA